MKQSKKTHEALPAHFQKYPHLQLRDIFKFIHQSAFGCEHLVSSLNAATEYIRTEYKNGNFPSDAPLVEALDGAYSRVHLTYLNHGLSVETLGKLFFASAKEEHNGKEEVAQKLCIAKALVKQGALPFSVEAFEEEVAKWQQSGYSAIHHSDVFRAKYRPAYRVISNEFVPFLPLLAKLDQALTKGRVVIAIEGGSASGKTTLGKLLETLYGCSVIHMDDFFLRPEQRTPQRYAQIGGNIDYERFAKEILPSLRKNEPICYKKFDCATMTLSDTVRVVAEKLVVVEGVYSLHPHFGRYFDLSVFLDISPELQKERIAKRNPPQIAKRFHESWIPLENLYFSDMQVKKRCDMSISIQK